MRLFLAIELPDEVRRQIAKLSGRYRDSMLDERSLGSRGRVTWVRAANLHVTMKFLGEVSPQDVPRLCEVLRRVSVEGSIPLKPDHMECFPPKGPIHVIAVGLGGDVGRLNRLFQGIDAECAEERFARCESRPYVPHITLARCHSPIPMGKVDRESLNRSAAGLLPGPHFEASEFVLMESHLRPEAAEYIPVARFPLRRTG